MENRKITSVDSQFRQWQATKLSNCIPRTLRGYLWCLYHGQRHLTTTETYIPRCWRLTRLWSVGYLLLLTCWRETKVENGFPTNYKMSEQLIVWYISPRETFYFKRTNESFHILHRSWYGSQRFTVNKYRLLYFKATLHFGISQKLGIIIYYRILCSKNFTNLYVFISLVPLPLPIYVAKQCPKQICYRARDQDKHYRTATKQCPPSLGLVSSHFTNFQSWPPNLIQIWLQKILQQIFTTIIIIIINV
jgi:hypothetical protein